MQTLDSSEDTDLELMFAEIRRYPLLTADEEKDIDSKKWDAVFELSSVIAEVDDLRRTLADLLHNAAECPPEVKRFPSREQHFTLRRELAPYLADGDLAAVAKSVTQTLTKRASKKRYADSVQALQIPASLSVGIAVYMLRRAGGQFPDAVADAIGHWSRHWQSPPAPLALEPAALKRIRKALRHYTEARDALVMHNLRLVHSIAGRYRGRGVGYLDLVQEGTLGLIRAAEKFEFSKGFRFSTYCFNWITQAVRRYVGDAGNLIRFPTHVQEQIGRLYKERFAEQARTGMDGDTETLAAAAGMDTEKARELLQLRNLTVSLDAPKYDDDEESMMDSLVGDTFGGAADGAEQRSLGNFLEHAIERLEANERQVITARWGLREAPPLTRAEIADKLGVSREWVRQLERSALKKLKGQSDVQHAFDDYRQSSNW